MNNFQLPAWGSNSPAMSFGPEPMNIPTWDVPSLESSAAPVAGSVAPVNAAYQPLQFGMNMPTFQLGLQGLGTLGSLWGTFQSNKLARDSFNFQKGFAERNLANQIKSYNTALTDRATTRGFVQGDSKDKTQQYINDNKL